MNLKQSIALHAESVNKEQAQKDNAAFVGKPFVVVDQGYGHEISEHDDYKDAFKAMLARPNSKIITRPNKRDTQQNRDAALKHSQEYNPDLDATSAAPVSPGSSNFKRNDAVDTPAVRDLVRRRQVKTNPDVD